MGSKNNLEKQISLFCPICNFNFYVESDNLLVTENNSVLNKCPSCNLIESIDDHISSVLRNIIINHYSPYAFEIDDKSRLRNDVLGFSFRQDRKHNLKFIDQAKEVHFKNFYMLLSSHIEAAFYDIEKFIDENMCSKFISKFTKNNHKSGYLYSLHKQNKLDIKPRFKNSPNFVRHMANVIKHNAGIVKKDSQSGGILVRDYKFKDGISLYEHVEVIAIKKIGIGNFRISNYYYLTCAIYVYLKDVISNLFSLPKLKEKKLDIVKITNSLVDFQIRKKVANLFLQELQEDALMIFPDSFVIRCDNKIIYEYLNNKIELLSVLKKTNPKNVINFEVIGEMNSNTKKALKLFEALSHIGFRIKNSNKKNKITKSDLERYRKLIEKIHQTLISKYGEDFVGNAFFNEFDQLNTTDLARLILDFYQLIYKEKKDSAALIIKVIGITPFKRWDPFLFGINRPNF